MSSSLLQEFRQGMLAAMGEGLEKEAGGLQSLGRAILKLRSLGQAGTLAGMEAKRLAALEAQMISKIGKGGMAKFNKSGVAALKGTGKAGGAGARRIKGTTARAVGTQKAVRVEQAAAAAGAQRLRPVASARTGQLTQRAAKQQRTAFRQSEGFATGRQVGLYRGRAPAYQQHLAATRPTAALPGAPTAVTTTRAGAGAPVRSYTRGPVYSPMQRGMLAGFMGRARKVTQHPYFVPAAVGAGAGLVGGAALS